MNSMKHLEYLLGKDYVSVVESETPENRCKHMVRYIQREVIGKERKVSLEFVREVLQQAALYYKSKKNVVFVNRLCFVDEALYSGRVTVVGDLHGQYRDLRYLLSPNGPIGFPTPANQVIFNGDMVDRGDMSVEIIVFLSLISFLSPGSVHMLKGNHEASRHLTDNLGFCNEVRCKYASDKPLLQSFFDLFAALPVAAVVDNAVFVVHGGLGRHTNLIAHLNEDDRSVPAKRKSALYDMLWNDPVKGCKYDGMQPNKRGEAFGHSVTEAFLDRNRLKLLIRSHEYCEQGYVKQQKGLCCTVFSAPNYCGKNSNKGAIIPFEHADSTEPAFVQFEAHHYTTNHKKNKHVKRKRYEDEDEELQLALKLSAEQDVDHELLRAIELSKKDVRQQVYYVDDEFGCDICAVDEPEAYATKKRPSCSSSVVG